MKYLVLNDGLTVTEVFFYELLHQVDDIRPAMIPGEKYELKVLCGATSGACTPMARRKRPAGAWSTWWRTGCCRFTSPRADTSIRSSIRFVNTATEIGRHAFVLAVWRLFSFRSIFNTQEN